MNTVIDQVYAIILAAGSSSRLGSPKQLLDWRNSPLLEHALVNAQKSVNERVVVVLGAEAASIQSVIDFSAVTVIVNPDWQEGMASSIRAGVQALPKSASAALILLCDQPLINAAQIQNLLHHWQNAPTHIIASQYHQALGVPALFPASYFETLLQLKGDRGAKSVLLQYKDSVLAIPLPEAEMDIDCEEDFARLLSEAG